MSPSWEPFELAPRGAHADAPRSIQNPDGIGDRLRAAAFAELQAYHAFLWAADRFEDTPPALKSAWRGLALAEQRHLRWLLDRMESLGIPVPGRKVSDQLWHSLVSCKSAHEFAIYMASAEERGRRAGERFFEAMRGSDPITAEIFRKIAEEEIEHIRLAERFFPAESTEAHRLHKGSAVEQGSTRGPEV
jgi:uncharacterized ferritin-like protein (DUF455 family)